jgi:hypothetical protein
VDHGHAGHDFRGQLAKQPGIEATGVNHAYFSFHAYPSTSSFLIAAIHPILIVTAIKSQ